jgi:hypothetical protein
MIQSEFKKLIETNREEAVHNYFTASIERWLLEDGPEEIVRILTIWTTRTEPHEPRIVLSDEMLLELGEGRTYDEESEVRAAASSFTSEDL